MSQVEQERVQLEEIQQTEQAQKAPPPPRPPAPVEAPNDRVLADVPLDLDAGIDINEPVVDLPPPPPAPKQEEKKQETKKEDPLEIFVVVEEMPHLLPNDREGLQRLQESIHYPTIAQKAGVQGRVIVQFVVDEKGNVTDPVVLRGIGGGCDEEAVRAVSLLRFKPGKQRGRPVRVRYTLPVQFRLRDSR